jgi:hypothetical protein
MQNLSMVQGSVKDCCRAEEFNLRVVEETPLPGECTRVVRECMVCSAKHYELSVPAITIGMTGNDG